VGQLESRGGVVHLSMDQWDVKRNTILEDLPILTYIAIGGRVILSLLFFSCREPVIPILLKLLFWSKLLKKRKFTNSMHF
jgi:hypothetical protein